ncbi:hypothetical protein [Metabacillus sp. cB07]|uniref:hypothetical protein n=1 Tax=Metabacillus TaxID=2675233 RepID=UPI0019392743|nr:hypothetical protein [Metabacillus sp. cB07]
MGWIVGLLAGTLGLAYFIDRKRTNRKTVSHNPGEEKNFMMGDNRYSGGGE